MEIENSVLQSKLLEMMKIFHKVCEEHHLKYYMLGGTCLGAIRHKGFIPWDDDMDIGLPRKDYNRLCEKWKEILPYPLELRYYKTEPKSPFHFIKLINGNTTLIEQHYKTYIEGIYIDVFPLDAMNEFGLFERLRYRIIYLFNSLLCNHCSTTPQKGVCKSLFKMIAENIPISLMHNVLEKAMTLNKYEKSKYLCNFLGAWCEREFIDYEYFGEPKLYPFENAFFYEASTRKGSHM